MKNPFLRSFFRMAFRLYKRHLEAQIQFDRWDPKLSEQIDAVTMIIES